MDNLNNVSSASTVSTNVFESIIDENENASLYYSFNETLKGDVSIDSKNCSEKEILPNDESSKLDNGTAIKRNLIETSSPQMKLVNKNLMMLNSSSALSYTSTPTQSPMKYKMSTGKQQQQKNDMVCEPVAEDGDISGISLLMQDLLSDNNSDCDENHVASNDEKKEIFSDSVTDIVTSKTTSLYEFEKFEKLIKEKQNSILDDDNNAKDQLNLSFEYLEKLRKTFNTEKEEGLNKVNVISCDKSYPTEEQNVTGENIKPPIPIIVVVPPDDKCEKILEAVKQKKNLENSTIERIKKEKNFNESIEILIEGMDKISDENKENVNILSNDLIKNKKFEMNVNKPFEMISSKDTEGVVKGNIIQEKSISKMENIQNDSEKRLLNGETKEDKINESTGSVLSLMSSSNSSVSKTITEVLVDVNTAKDFKTKNLNMIGKDEESSEKETENVKKGFCLKKKIRRSIRLPKMTRKSVIEETDSSSGATPHISNEKFRKLSSNKPSVHFSQSEFKESEKVISSQPDLLQNAPTCSMLNKRKSCQIQKPRTVSTQPLTNEKVQLFAAEKQTRSILKAGPSNVQQKNATPTITNKRKTMHLPTCNNKRMSILKTKAANSPNLIKKKPRLSNVLKTTLNSPAITRRSISRATTNYQVQLSRKSMIPVSNQPNKTPTATTTTTSSVKTTTDGIFETGVNKQPVATKFICRICHVSFKLKSLFETHKRIHEIGIKCEYCDRNFAFKKALDNHLIENCTKIPPLIKKKLIKAEIDKKSEERMMKSLLPPPSVQPMSISSSLAFLRGFRIHENASTSTNNVCNDDNSTDLNYSPSSNDKQEVSKLMPPPSSSASSSSTTKSKNCKIRRNQMPHSGVYRTPNKPILCYKCKKNFLNVVEFTEHTISSHTSSSSSSA